jgi:transcriptional regulator with XRE-family HTH domain
MLTRRPTRLSRELKRARAKSGLSQEQLAQAAGLSARCVRKLEAGKGSLAALQACYAILGLDFTYQGNGTKCQHLSTLKAAQTRDKSRPLLWPMELPQPAVGQLYNRPCSQAEANELIVRLSHRHHGPFLPGAKSCVCTVDKNGVPHGAVVAARAASRTTEQVYVLEVSRLVTDGAPNAVTKLLSAVHAKVKGDGYWWGQTFILEHETGDSYRAASWLYAGESDGSNWHSETNRAARINDNPGPKHKWIYPNRDTPEGRAMYAELMKLPENQPKKPENRSSSGTISATSEASQLPSR